MITLLTAYLLICLLIFPVHAAQTPENAQLQNTESGNDSETQELEKTVMGQLDDADIQALLDQSMVEEISISDMVRQLIKGKLPLSRQTVWKMVQTVFFQEIEQNKKQMVSILLLCVLAALFTNFTKVFQKSVVADISFYILYLLLLTILLQSFVVVQNVAASVLSQMSEFMKLLLPIFFMTVVAAKGGTTALVFYEVILGCIYVVSLVLVKILLPLCSIYVMITLVNQMSKEDIFSKMGELLKQIVLWSLKTLFGLVVGINMVHSMITPAIDDLKSGALRKVISGIPGIGNTMGSMGEMIIGSAVLIKNSVGVCILILLVLICLVPIIKLFCCMLLYKITAAVIQPISDKRVINCVEAVADGTGLLMKCVITTMSLFLITMAILTVAAG